ncbi:MAG: VOC family protein [Proteobacteria bacterium]|nr:MAG: VOC family protein [Pseudomonadota bacterium]
MSLIDGIGGAFLFSNDPKTLLAWYRDVLGIFPDGRDEDEKAEYRQFEYRDLDDPTRKKSTTWAILPAKDDIAGKPRTGRINYRVKDMSEMLKVLSSKGVAVTDQNEYDYGKFAWLQDPEGNQVELFEEL